MGFQKLFFSKFDFLGNRTMEAMSFISYYDRCSLYSRGKQDTVRHLAFGHLLLLSRCRRVGIAVGLTAGGVPCRNKWMSASQRKYRTRALRYLISVTRGDHWLRGSGLSVSSTACWPFPITYHQLCVTQHAYCYLSTCFFALIICPPNWCVALFANCFCCPNVSSLFGITWHHSAESRTGFNCKRPWALMKACLNQWFHRLVDQSGSMH